MTRRAPGEGSLYQTPDGTWHGSISFGIGPAGKRIRMHVRAKTKTAAAEKLRARIRDKEDGLVPTGAQPTVEAWLIQWLELTARTRKESTYKTYKTICQYAIGAFGQVKLDQVTTEHIEMLYAKLAKRGMLPATEAGVHRTLHAAFGEAMKRHQLVRNPVDHARHRPVREDEVRPLSVDEAKAVLRAAKAGRQAARWEVALALGMRQGEVLGLQWGDIDFDRKMLSVRRAAFTSQWRHGCSQGTPTCGGKPARCPNRTNGGVRVGPPKSRRALRTIAMPEYLVGSLMAHQVAQEEECEAAGAKWDQGPGWVFPSRTGHLVRSNDDWAAWKELLKQAGVRDARLHDARHTAATFMLANEVDGRVVMDILGWSRLEMVSRYQHVSTALQEEAARRMNGLLFEDRVTEFERLDQVDSGSSREP